MMSYVINIVSQMELFFNKQKCMFSVLSPENPVTNPPDYFFKWFEISVDKRMTWWYIKNEVSTRT